MADMMSRLHIRQLPRGGLPTMAPTHPCRLYRKFDEDNEEGSEGHIVTYIKDDYQDVRFTTSTSNTRSSKASRNFIMLATTIAVH